MREPDRLRCDVPADAMVLGHHESGDHPPRFADVELVRPAAVVGELVAAQAESAHLVADGLRHA